jgi:hypothetical protein
LKFHILSAPMSCLQLIYNSRPSLSFDKLVHHI